MQRGIHIRRRLIAALVVAVALIAPTQAGAATASLSGATLTVNSGNEASDLTITLSGGALIVADANADVTTTLPCSQTNDVPKRVTCPAAGVEYLSSSLGDGNDRLDSSAGSLIASVSGGNGDDHLTTGLKADTLNGDAGKDSVDGGLGNDTLLGGGDGDVLVYTSHTVPVTVSLGSDNQSSATTGNGQSGESDWVRYFEHVQGGAGNDSITGDSNDNFLAGGGGNDTVGGGSGSDFVGYWDRSTGVTVNLATRTGGDTAGRTQRTMWSGSTSPSRG
jgi:Ca2+-binding RTX toxin-like protein